MAIEMCINEAPIEAQRKWAATNERFEQIETALKRSGIGAGHIGEFVEVGKCKMRHGIRLEVAPQVFDRVHLRRVGRKKGAAYVRMRIQKITHVNRSMRRALTLASRCRRKYRRTRFRSGATHNAPITLTLRCERVR